MFQLPFDCDEVWRLTTYSTHDDYDIDFFAKHGPTPGRRIIASAAGTVEWAGWNGKDVNNNPLPPGTVGTAKGLGYGVIIDHGGGWFTVYGHMVTWPAVSTNDPVVQGQFLGAVGKTGATQVEHLHYEQLDDSLDPTKTRGVLDKVQSYFGGVPSGITSDGNPTTGPLYISGPTSPSTERTSNNCSGPQGSSGDITGDGNADILAKLYIGDALTYVGSGTINGTGTFDPVGTLTRQNWNDVVNFDLGDVNGDTYADILAQHTNGDAKVYVNYGGYFAGISSFDITGVLTGTGWGGIANFAFGDVSGDGLADILAQFPDGTVRVYKNNGGLNGIGTFDNVGVVTGTGWTDVVNFDLGDVNGDGFADIMAQFADGNVQVYANRYGLNGIYTFENVGVQTGSGWTGIPNFALGDIDGDDLADLLIQFADGNARVYRNNGGLNGFYTFDNVGQLTGTGWGTIGGFAL